jgi:hypothetical protein
MLLTVTGCASTPTETATVPNGDKPLDPLVLVPATDVYLTRITLSEGDPSLTAVPTAPGREKPEELEGGGMQFVGARLGNGLFLDANLNLGLDVIQLFGLDRSRDFRIELVQHQFGQANYRIERDDSFYERRPSLPFWYWHTVRFSDDAARVSIGGLSQGAVEVFQTDERAVVDPGVFTRFRRVEVVQERRGHVLFPRQSGRMAAKISDEGDALTVGNQLTVAHEGTRLRIVRTARRARPWFFYRIDGGFRYVNPSGYGFEVRVNTSQIEVYEDGTLLQTYTLLEGTRL